MSLALPSVLLVDDDRELDQMLTEYLSGEGFAVSVATAGPEALERLAAADFDLAILDVMLPRLTGFDVLRRLRQTLAMPVIMLTARGEDADRILGLELGADDYLPKPFNPRELVARMRAVLRRSVKTANVPDTVKIVGPLRVDGTALEASIGDRPLKLTATEFRVLELLVERAGQIQTRESLTERALGRRLLADDRSIDTHISNIRRKLGVEDGHAIEIRNVRGRGYVLIDHEGEG